MVDVQRDANGRIMAVRHGSDAGQAAADGQWEAIPADDPGLAAFASQIQSSDTSNPLVGSDLAMARVLEDLVNLLIDKSVIRFTDLPQGAQAKLLARHNTRAALSRLRLMGDSDSEQREII